MNATFKRWTSALSPDNACKDEGTRKRSRQDRDDLQWLPLSDGVSTDHYDKCHSDCSVSGVYDAQSISCTIKTLATSSYSYSS